MIVNYINEFKTEIKLLKLLQNRQTILLHIVFN